MPSQEMPSRDAQGRAMHAARSPRKDAAAQPSAKVSRTIKRAIAAIEAGDKPGARRILDELHGNQRMSTDDVLRLTKLLIFLGEPDAAKVLAAKAHEQLAAAAERRSDDPQILTEIAALCAIMGRDDAALTWFRRALELDPENTSLALQLAMIELRSGQTETAMTRAVQIVDDAGTDLREKVVLTRIFQRYRREAEARQLLTLAQRHHPGATKLALIQASLDGTDPPRDHHKEAVEIFDGFAGSYDENLAGLANRGPQLVGEALDRLALARDGSRRVLDAGCGTGLCAPHLRPYAQELHGIDISVQMLKAAQDKGVYDYLCRTDLTRPETYPEGLFGLAACADVLVYLPDLAPVLTNIFRALMPGGWLIFTVELDRRPTLKGWRIDSSGRYLHGADYVAKALSGAGFLKPEICREDVLRQEFRDPVECLVVAAQKPALALWG